MPMFSAHAASPRPIRSIGAREPLSPADRLIVVQSALLIAVSSWGGGGWLPGVLPVMVALATSGLIAVWLRWREHEPLSPIGLLPLGLWLGLLTIALMNPSHTPAANGTWLPRHGWIPWLPTTISQSKSLEAQMPWIVALLQAGVLVAARPHRRAVRYLWTFAALNGFTLAVLGAGFYFAQSDRMLGVIDTSAQYFFATFFYKNHWAAYGWLGAIASASLAVRAAQHAGEGDPRGPSLAFFFGAVGLLTAITLPLPGSRAGAILAALFIAILSLSLLTRLWPKHRTWNRSQIIAAILALGLFLGTVGFGVHAYAGRAREDLERTERQIAVARGGESPEIRLLVSRDTWRMALARPWFGWGVGSFELAFPLYQGSYLRDEKGRPTAHFEFAHNDWLQMFAETGLTGLAVLLISLTRIAYHGWSHSVAAGRIVLIGCAIIALYAWVDFPLNNPGVLVLWTILVVTVRRSSEPTHQAMPAASTA